MWRLNSGCILSWNQHYFCSWGIWYTLVAPFWFVINCVFYSLFYIRPQDFFFHVIRGFCLSSYWNLFVQYFQDFSFFSWIFTSFSGGFFFCLLTIEFYTKLDRFYVMLNLRLVFWVFWEKVYTYYCSIFTRFQSSSLGESFINSINRIYCSLFITYFLFILLLLMLQKFRNLFLIPFNSSS